MRAAFLFLLVLLGGGSAVASTGPQPVDGALVRVCSAAVVHARGSLSLAEVTWRLRRWWRSGPRTDAQLSRAITAFLARFPKASYSLLSVDRRPLAHFFFQVGKHDFRSETPLRFTLPYLVQREYLFGLIPHKQSYERFTPAETTLAPTLVRGWQRLGLIDREGKFDFSLSPALLRERFTAATGWRTLRRPEGDAEAVLTARQKHFLERVVVLDDTFDYLFVLPLLTTPTVAEIFSAYARMTAFETRTLFDEELKSWEGRSDPRVFLRLLAQDSFTADAPLYSAGPLVHEPSEPLAQAEIDGDLVKLSEWLGRPDEFLLRRPLKSRDVFGLFTAPMLRLHSNYPVRHFLDALIVAVAEQLYRIASIVDDRGRFSPEALAFSRERVLLLQRLFAAEDRERLPEELRTRALSGAPLALPAAP